MFITVLDGSTRVDPVWADPLPSVAPYVSFQPIPDAWGGGFLVMLIPTRDRQYPTPVFADVPEGALAELVQHPDFIRAMKGDVVAELRFGSSGAFAEFAAWYADYLRKTKYRRVAPRVQKNAV